jgi:hypothetical protein
VRGVLPPRRQQGRAIVYVSGRLIGVWLASLFGVVVGFLLWAADVTDRETILICDGAGAIGALVSALSRMSRAEHGRFNIDFELGRPLMRQLGAYRPFLGGAIGVALYFLLASGLLDIQVDDDEKPYYYGFFAFLDGFSERFATLVLGAAEQKLAPGEQKRPRAEATTTRDDRQSRSRPHSLAALRAEREAGSVTTPMSRSDLYATRTPGEGQFSDRTEQAAQQAEFLAVSPRSDSAADPQTGAPPWL